MIIDNTAWEEPKYMVIDPNPPFTTVVGNIRTFAYFPVATLAGLSARVGYLYGFDTPGIRRPLMVVGGLCGLMGGFMLAYQESAGRLKGFFPNDDEVLNVKKMKIGITEWMKPKYTVIDRNPPFTTVVGNFSTFDYFHFATITGISARFGYLAGDKPPGIRGRLMVRLMVIGLMGGFMFAYGKSAGRLKGHFRNDDEVARCKK